MTINICKTKEHKKLKEKEKLVDKMRIELIEVESKIEELTDKEYDETQSKNLKSSHI